MRRQDMTRTEAEELLDLPERYGMEDVRGAFKRLAREYHPDNAARNGLSQKFAQQRMTQVNKAYSTLKALFGPDVASLHRDFVGGARGRHGVGVHYTPTGESSMDTQVDDSLFWDENGNPRSAVTENEANAAADAPGHGLRRLVLGPVLPRVLVCALLALLWWATFPFLPHNSMRYSMGAEAGALDIVGALSAAVYPSYFLLYELVTGNISGTLRECANGIVSLVTGTHVEVRRRGAYRSSVSSLVRDQIYPVLELPLAAWLLARGLLGGWPNQPVLLAVGAILAMDALIGFFGSGLVMGASRWLSALIERRYVTMRMDMLKRCGQWASSAHHAR